MITDAEGHVIAINKTDTDRLIVTITVYLNLTLPSFVEPLRSASQSVWSFYADTLKYTDWENSAINHLWFIVRRLFGITSNYGWKQGWDQYVRCCTSPGCPYGFATTSEGTLVRMQVNSEATATGVRVSNTQRILSADMNLSSTYQIYGFASVLGYIPITADIFPPLNLTLEQVADGTQTGFNFGIPELMSEVNVYVNNELQPASAYTWNGTDYTNSFQAWETSKADKVIITPCVTYTYHSGSPTRRSAGIFQATFSANSLRMSCDYVVYDFKTTQTMTRAYKPTVNKEYTDWEYSDDNEHWTTLVIPSTADNYYDFPTPPSARYWKATTFGSAYWNHNWTPQHSVLCNFSNQLEFNSPPPADAIVKIEAKSAYPIKNENWLVDQFVLDFTVSRG